MFIIFAIFMIGSLLSLTAYIYAVFLPFVDHVGTTKYYNMAYYGAVASVERAYSALRYHQPGFQATGGWLGEEHFGAQSDARYVGLGQISQKNNGMYRTISSRRRGTIPGERKSTIPDFLYGSGNETFDLVDYHRVYTIPFVLDNSDANNSYRYPDSGDLSLIRPQSLSITFRLPQTALDSFGEKLCDEYPCDIDRDSINDDVVISWKLFGKYRGVPFSILPTIGVNYSYPTSVNQFDSAIRERVINESHQGSRVRFANDPNPVNPFSPVNQFNIIPQSVSLTPSFTQLFADQGLDTLSLQFSLINYLQTSQGYIYPGLESRISFCENDLPCMEVSDMFYEVKGIGKVRDYKVQIDISKPVSSDNVISDFAIAF